MHMIGHYNVATDSDTMLLCFGTKNAKCFMDFRSCQQVLTFVCVECDEVKRANIVKQTTETWRPARPFYFVHGRHNEFLLVMNCESNPIQERCSHGAVSPCVYLSNASAQRGGYIPWEPNPTLSASTPSSVFGSAWRNDRHRSF